MDCDTDGLGHGLVRGCRLDRAFALKCGECSAVSLLSLETDFFRRGSGGDGVDWGWWVDRGSQQVTLGQWLLYPVSSNAYRISCIFLSPLCLSVCLSPLSICLSLFISLFSLPLSLSLPVSLSVYVCLALSLFLSLSHSLISSSIDYLYLTVCLRIS